jgi:hypothetical protein
MNNEWKRKEYESPSIPFHPLNPLLTTPSFIIGTCMKEGMNVCEQRSKMLWWQKK